MVYHGMRIGCPLGPQSIGVGGPELEVVVVDWCVSALVRVVVEAYCSERRWFSTS
jgi:hypothetical protein